MIGGNSMIGSGSRRQLDHPEDIAPYEKEYNTDISQFLNSKQTFNNSITTSTERDLDSVGHGFGEASRDRAQNNDSRLIQEFKNRGK